MKFYDAIQLDARGLKPLIKNANNKKEKQKYTLALIVKNLLCMLFCFIVITFFYMAFGTDNGIVGVVTVVALLTFRLSNLDFKTNQSTIAILGIFLLLAVSPYLASISNPILGFIINFVSILVILIVACHNTILSNQSIFILSYLLLYGNKVCTMHSYINRVFSLTLGAFIVAGIFYNNHKKINFNNKFIDILRDFNFNNERTKWQIKLALAISIAILFGQLIQLPRVIWVGFSTLSIIHHDKHKINMRAKTRWTYIIIGCVLCSVVYIILPPQFKCYIGILGGIMAGFSSTYEWQTSFNCFGALTPAIPIFGIGGAIIIRILNNIIGSLYSTLFNKLFDYFDHNILSKSNIKEISKAS